MNDIYYKLNNNTKDIYSYVNEMINDMEILLDSIKKYSCNKVIVLGYYNITNKNNDIFTLSAIFNTKYNENKYERLIDKGFFKLSYKEKYKLTTSDGEETFYNYFIKINKAGE